MPRSLGFLQGRFDLAHPILDRCCQDSYRMSVGLEQPNDAFGRCLLELPEFALCRVAEADVT